MRLKRVRRLRDHVQWMSVAVILGDCRLLARSLPLLKKHTVQRAFLWPKRVKTFRRAGTARQDESPSTLSGITFFSGPPEEKASLAYDQWTRRNGLAYGIWHFPKSSHRIWLSCHFSFTRVVLVKATSG